MQSHGDGMAKSPHESPSEQYHLDIEIRKAEIDDVGTIARFNTQLALETEGKMLDPASISAGVTRLIGEPARGQYWVAVTADRIVGQIAVTYEWSDWRNGVLWWIGSVYIDADFRRQGVFSSLYKHVESHAMSDPGACGMRLYVERDNERAQQTYQSLAMQDAGYLVMESIFTSAEESANA